MTTKYIKDSIHGFIEFEGEGENALKDLLSNPFLQRLRRVKQLGFSDYVFPSATHSRFAHSLGVYSISKRMLSIIEPDARKGNWSNEGQACLAAALLHDVGHGMFSHAFENAMNFFLERNPIHGKVFPGLKDAVNHEKVSRKIITASSIGEALVSLGGQDFPKLVADMVTKPVSKNGCVYTSIVSSQLDADRLDYAKRDPYFAGVSSGGLDIDWLIQNLKVGENGENKFFYVNSKAYISLEQFAVTLFHLYPTIYLHKRTRGLEYMFAMLMSRIFELIATGDEAKAGISANHPFVKFFHDPSNLQNALLLDDTLFWGSLYLLQNATDPSVSTMAERIALRKIYPMIDVWKIADELAVDSRPMLQLSAVKRVTELNNICEVVCCEIQKKKDIWVDGCYYDNYNRPIYNKKETVGGHPQQINVEVGGKVIDIASISPMVASAASFNIHRVYYDDTKDLLRDNLEKEIKLLIKGRMNIAALSD